MENTVNEASSRDAEEEELRYWLANEDWYMSTYTRKWLERTPPQEATEMLAHIAQDAQPEPRSFWSMFVTGFATVGFLPTGGAKIAKRKAGIRAALMLASRDDARCLAPLVRVFETREVWKNKYQEFIEVALTRYLKEATTPPDAALLRDLMNRLWNTELSKRDLTPAQVNLALAIVQRLQTSGSREDQATLQEITVAPSGKPNRERVQQALQPA